MDKLIMAWQVVIVVLVLFVVMVSCAATAANMIRKMDESSKHNSRTRVDHTFRLLDANPYDDND